MKIKTTLIIVVVVFVVILIVILIVLFCVVPLNMVGAKSKPLIADWSQSHIVPKENFNIGFNVKVMDNSNEDRLFVIANLQPGMEKRLCGNNEQMGFFIGLKTEKQSKKNFVVVSTPDDLENYMVIEVKQKLFNKYTKWNLVYQNGILKVQLFNVTILEKLTKLKPVCNKSSILGLEEAEVDAKNWILIVNPKGNLVDGQGSNFDRWNGRVSSITIQNKKTPIKKATNFIQRIKGRKS